MTRQENALPEFQSERDRLARLTRKGLGTPHGRLDLPARRGGARPLASLPERGDLELLREGAVFPLGAALTRLAGGDLFAKSAVLTPLGLLLAAVQLFYRPIIILVWIQAPEWTFYVMAVLFGSHFLPYAWLYRSPAYAVLSILTTVVLTAAVWVAGAPLQETVPLLAAGCYFLSVMLLIREVSRSEPTAG